MALIDVENGAKRIHSYFKKLEASLLNIDSLKREGKEGGRDKMKF